MDLDSIFAQVPDGPKNKSSLDLAFEQLSDGNTAATEKPVVAAPSYPDVIPTQDLGAQKQDIIKPPMDYSPAAKWKINLDYSQDKDTIANTSGEVVEAFGGRFDKALAGMFDALDYVQTSAGDALNQILVGREAAVGIRDARNKRDNVTNPLSEGLLSTVRPFKAISNAINFAASGGKELPNTIGGQIIGGVADIGPQILAAWVAPEIKAGQLMSKLGMPILSKFGLVMGTEGMIQGMKESETASTVNKLTVPIIKGVEQYMTGQMYDMAGEMASKVGGRLSEKLIPEYQTGMKAGMTKTERIDSPFSHPDIKLSNDQLNTKMLINSLGTTAFNANFIGGYGTLLEFLETGDTSWKTYAVGVGTGIGLSGHQLAKIVWSKGMTSFMAADPAMIERTINHPASSEELITLAQEKFKSVSNGTSKNPEGDITSGLLATRVAVLKGVLEEIQVNPTDVLKTIDESTMSPEMKQHLTDNVNQIIANSDQAVVESKPLNDKIKAIDDEIEMIKNNSNLAPTDQEIKTQSLAAKREGLVNKVIEIHAKYTKIKTPAEQAVSEAKIKEDTKQANIMEIKASILYPKFNDELTVVANEVGGRVETRLKTPESMVGKATRTGMEILDIPDVIGGAIILPDMKNFKYVSKKLKEAGYTISNKRVPSRETGWRGVIATKVVDGVGTEIQIHSEATWKAHQEALEITNKYRNPEIRPESQKVAEQKFNEAIPPPSELNITSKGTMDGLDWYAVELPNGTMADFSVKEGTPKEAVDKLAEEKRGMILPEDSALATKQTETFTDPEKSPLKTTQYAILTAENPGGKALSVEENVTRNEALIKELEDAGFKPIPVEGHYGGNPEHSFIVPGMTDEEALAFGERHGQESVLTPKGLLYQDGTYNPADVSKIDFASDKTDFYSTLKVGDQEVKFSIPIDFDQKLNLREKDLEIARGLYEEGYKGFENINLEGSKALTPAQRKAKEIGIPIAQQKELNKAWTETKNMLVGELKGKNADIKAKFKDFVNGLPSLPGLGIRLRAGMLKKVNAIDFTKPASLNRAIEYFDKIVNNATFRFNEAKAEQALSILDIKSTEASLTKKSPNQPDKNIKGPTGLPLWDEIKVIRKDMLEKDWQQGQEAIQAIYDKVDSEGRLGPTAEEMNQITRYNLWGALNSTNRADANALQGMARDLMGIRKQGSSEAAAAKMIQQAQETETRIQQVDVLTGQGKKPIKGNREAQNEKDSFVKKLRGVFDWPMSSSFFSHLDFLSQHDKTSEPGESFLERSLGEPFWEANLRIQEQRKSLFNEMDNKFSEIWDVPSGTKAHNLGKEHTNKVYEIKYKDVMGKEQDLNLTMNQAIKVYMELQDPTLEGSHEAGYYKRNGELTELGQGVMDILTPEAKAWGDWQLNEFYPKLYEMFNPVYRQLYGRDMPHNSAYSPIFIEGADAKGVTPDDLLSRQSFVSQLKNGSLLSRVKHKKPLLLMDADQVLMSYMHNMTYWATHSEPISMLNNFIKDPTIRSAIKQNFTNGDMHLRYLQKTVDDLMRKPSDAWMTANTFRKIRNNVLVASLAAKIPIGINQVASSLAFADYIPASEVPKYSIQSLTKWLGDKGNVALAKKIWNTTYIQQRYGQGWDNVLTEIMESDYHSVGEKGGLKSWRNKMMSPLMGGDFTAILLGGIPLYRYTYDQAMKKYGSGSERLAEAEALHVVTRAADDTQQSGLWFNLSQAQTANEFYKSMTMYKSANMQYQRKVSEGVRGLIHGRGSVAQNLKTIALYHVILPMVYQYFANGFNWNTEDEARAGILGNLNDLFVAGDIIEGIINTVNGEPWKKYRVSPLLSTVDDAIAASEHIMKIKTTERQLIKGIPENMIPMVLEQAEKMNLYDMNYVELGKTLKYASKVIGAGTGLPVAGVTAMGRGMYDVITGKETGNTKDKVLRILGRTAYKGKDAVNESDLTPEQIDEILKARQKTKEEKKPVPKPAKIPNF